jgi:hypothetical protein
MKNELHVELLPSKLRWYESEIYTKRNISTGWIKILLYDPTQEEKNDVFSCKCLV